MKNKSATAIGVFSGFLVLGVLGFSFVDETKAFGPGLGHPPPHHFGEEPGGQQQWGLPRGGPGFRGEPRHPFGRGSHSEEGHLQPQERTSFESPQRGFRQGRPERNQESRAELPDGVSSTENWVEISIEGDRRIIKSNGIADHDTGTFPNSQNPNGIEAQYHEFKIPVNPTYTDNAVQARIVGVALNGLPIEPGTAEKWTGGTTVWNYEGIQGTRLTLGLDHQNAHVQPGGKYHYHGVSDDLVSSLSSDVKGTQIAWAADGFPIYYRADIDSSYQLKSGNRPDGSEGPGGTYDGTFTQDYDFVAGAGDLDACNGIFIGDEYVYYATDAFPFFPRCLKGNADSSFAGGHGPRPEEPQGVRGGPQPNFGQSQSQRPSRRPGNSGLINKAVSHTEEGINLEITSLIDQIVERLQNMEVPVSRNSNVMIEKSNTDEGVILSITSEIESIIERLQERFLETE